MSRGLAVLAVAVSVSCAGQSAQTGERPESESGSPECDPVEYSLESPIEVSALTGTFALTLVATSGDSSGRRAEGRLTLEPTDREDAVLAGSADAPVERVDAYRVGRLDASGDSAPGVLVFLSEAASPSILLRLGSGANARGVVQPIEGEFTALRVHRIDAQGFAGSWRSGANVDRAVGHFCARRLPAAGG